MKHEIGIQPRIANRTDLLLIGKNGKSRVYRGSILHLSHQRCVGADPVILAIGTYQAAVETDIHSLNSRHHLNLGTGKVFFCHSIALIQKLHGKQFDRRLDFLVLTIHVGNGADHNI